MFMKKIILIVALVLMCACTSKTEDKEDNQFEGIVEIEYVDSIELDSSVIDYYTPEEIQEIHKWKQ